MKTKLGEQFYQLLAAGVEVRVYEGRVEKRRMAEGFWRPCDLQALLCFPQDSGVWKFLRARGIARPEPVHEPKDDRPNVRVTLTIRAEVADYLSELAWEDSETEAEIVEMLVEREHRFR